MNASDNSKAPEFVDLLIWIALACAKRIRALLLGFVAVALASSLLVLFVLEERYGSSATILPPQGSGAGMMSGLGKLSEELGPLALGMGLGGGGTQETYLMMTLLESHELQLSLINKFHLDSIYEFKKGKPIVIADLLKAFRRNFTVEMDDDTEYLIIGMEAKDPKLAQDVVNAAIRKLDSAYVQVKASQAGKARRYFEERIAVNQKTLDSLKGLMQAFQETHSIIEPKMQLEESIKRQAQLELDKEAAYIQWQAECHISGCEGSIAKKLETNYRTISESLAKKKADGKASGWMDMKKTPSLLRQYEDLYTALTINETIYTYLRQMYEQALLEEMDKVGRFEVLEKPWANDKRVAPRRRAIVTSLLLSYMVIAMLACVFLEMYADDRAASNERYKKLAQIAHCLRLGRKGS